MRNAWPVALSVLVLAAACSGDDNAAPDAGPDAGTTPDAAPDPSDALFRPDHVLQVEITMAAADWATLRAQSPTGQNGSCTSQGVDAYTTFHADLQVDGTTYADVGIRKKGNLGSVSSTRPGLKLDVHEFVPDQRIFGLKHLTLNNNNQDATRISQCLGYGLYARAGLPASRCNFAHVVVNGEDLGVYTNVETIKDNFLRRNFGDDSGNLYESGGDFTPTGIHDFQPKTNPSAPDCSDLEPIANAMTAADGGFPGALGAVVDLDEVTRYWAMEVLTGHWDGYANNRNNFYFYHSPTTGKVEFIPWGLDALFTSRTRTTRPQSVYACGAMAWRLYDVAATRAPYLTALHDVIAEVWHESEIDAEITRMQGLIAPYETADLADRIQVTRDFVAGRRAVLEAELAAGEPVWPYPAGEASCLIDLGTMSATFSTTWDSLGQFPAGSGTMSGTISGIDLGSSTVYATAGQDTDGVISMQLLSPLPDGRYAVVFLSVRDPAAYVTGAQPIDLVHVFAMLVFYDPATDTAEGGGLLLPGTFTLTHTSMVPGGAVTGSFTGHVREL